MESIHFLACDWFIYISEFNDYFKPNPGFSDSSGTSDSSGEQSGAGRKKPTWKYPCAVCAKPVCYNQKGIFL